MGSNNSTVGTDDSGKYGKNRCHISFNCSTELKLHLIQLVSDKEIPNIATFIREAVHDRLLDKYGIILSDPMKTKGPHKQYTLSRQTGG